MPLSKTITDMLKGGHINLLKVEDRTNYVLAFIYADHTKIVPMINSKDGRGYLAYVAQVTDADLTETDKDAKEKQRKKFEDENNIIKQFIETAMGSLYNGFPAYKVTSNTVPPHNTVIKEFVQPDNAELAVKADDSQLLPALEKEGYDVSALRLVVSAPTFVRDYSQTLKEDTEAQKAFDFVKKTVEGKIGGVKIEEQPPKVQLVYEGIKTGRLQAVMFIGPAGTGKSVACMAIAYALGAPALIYEASEGSQSEDMMGGYKPSEDKDKQYEHYKGLALKAFTEGYILIINEFNFAPVGLQSLFNQFTDDTPVIEVDGVTYERHPNFVVFLTINPGYKGTEPMNQALKSRFYKVVLDKLDVNEYVKRMQQYSEYQCGRALNEKFFKKLYELDAVIETQARGWNENIAMCIRNAQQLTGMITMRPFTQAEFEEAVKGAYYDNLCCDMDNLENLKVYLSSDLVKEKIAELFNLYDYRVNTSVPVEETFDDCYVEPVYNETEENAVKKDGIDDDDASDLDGIDDDTSKYDNLAEVVEEDESK